jgi:hypothetical protein
LLTLYFVTLAKAWFFSWINSLIFSLKYLNERINRKSTGNFFF